MGKARAMTQRSRDALFSWVDACDVVRESIEMVSRVASLQGNIAFLQKQHREILEKLHGEIDILKRENKGTFMLHSLTCYRNNVWDY